MTGLTEEQGKTICGKKIIICEGPAGAGKSTLLAKLEELPHCTVVRSSLNKRFFEKEEAASKSFFNDIFKAQLALAVPEPIVFIDRCFISQMVYHAIRTDRAVNLGPKIFEHIPKLVRSLEYDFSLRHNKEPRSIEIYYLFLIPKAAALHERRLRGGKDYPNRVEDEIYHYKIVSSHLAVQRMPTLRPQYNNIEDIDFIYRGFEHWLGSWPYLDFPGLWRSFVILPKEGQK